MKKLFVLIPLLLMAVLAPSGCGSSAERLNNDGNKAFAEQDYEGAMVAYNQAGEKSPEQAEPHYNAGSTHYRQQAYDQALQEIEQALVSKEAQEGLDQRTYYNLGDTLFQAQQYEPAIEAFKEALRLNPGDVEAKQNLELALRKLQQQQEQQQDQQQQEQKQQQEQQQQQDQQQQDQQQHQQKQDQQQQDQQQDQQKQDRQQQDQQQQDQQQRDQRQQDQQQDQQQQDQQQQDQQQDQQQQDQQQDQQQQDQQQQDQQQQDQRQENQSGGQARQITGLTREQAKQLFEAAAQNIQSLEEYLNQIMVFPWAPPARDW